MNTYHLKKLRKTAHDTFGMVMEKGRRGYWDTKDQDLFYVGKRTQLASFDSRYYGSEIKSFSDETEALKYLTEIRILYILGIIKEEKAERRKNKINQKIKTY